MALTPAMGLGFTPGGTTDPRVSRIAFAHTSVAGFQSQQRSGETTLGMYAPMGGPVVAGPPGQKTWLICRRTNGSADVQRIALPPGIGSHT